MITLSLKYLRDALVIITCLFNYIPIYVRNEAIKKENIKYPSVSSSIICHKHQQGFIP